MKLAQIVIIALPAIVGSDIAAYRLGKVTADRWYAQYQESLPTILIQNAAFQGTPTILSPIPVRIENSYFQDGLKLQCVGDPVIPKDFVKETPR